MRKLEDIPKKQLFTVPEGYFDKLPGIIQARVTTRQKSAYRPGLRLAVRYALPALVIALTVFWFTKPGQQLHTPEGILADIQTTDLVAYLDETDLSTDELLESVALDGMDAEQIEGEVYDLSMEDTDLDVVWEEMDLNEL